ncbi:hypothetical protein M9Y10_021212 [Tritrichomonas musculus]|uniref:Uncharacterized protein n=1 Tax=Tritrichomonas musculus TaxID=1915356 RepID=A0ABR2HDF3_9EUKA
MKNKDILMETLGKLISPRWVISNQKLELSLISKSDELTDFEIETTNYTASIKERYLEIKSRIQTIAELGCKNESSYEDAIRD